MSKTIKDKIKKNLPNKVLIKILRQEECIYLDKLRYELSVAVSNSCQIGVSPSKYQKWCFKKLENAKKVKDIIKNMMEKQKTVKNERKKGKAEVMFWDEYYEASGSTRYFYDVGKIVKISEKIVG